MNKPSCTNMPSSFSDCTNFDYEKMIDYVKELAEGRSVIKTILNSTARITAISECGIGFYDISGVFNRDPMHNLATQFKYKLNYWVQGEDYFFVFN